ncbi:MAG: hypothetical protein AB7O98_15340 [Hyphomonadaceae bacterium]
MAQKELGKSYLVVFCKGCGAGFRVRQEPVPEGMPHALREAETHTCPGCKHTAVYAPAEIRNAKFQQQGLGRRKGAK